MSFSTWIEQIGEGNFLALGGLLIGVVFGFWAQRSRFCLRSASLEVAHWQMGGKLAVWLFAFSAALLGTQAFILLGWLDVGNARQLASRGTLSGAIIGGALFGIGMVLARGCASRLLVLSATGNLRALLSGLVFAVVAQSAMTGLLSPLRLALSNLWAIDGGAGRDLLALLGWNHWCGLAFGVFWLCGGILFAWRSRLPWVAIAGGLLVGLMVAAAWLFNFQVANQSFNVVPVKSLSFTGPAADMLMLVLSPPGQTWHFDIGLVPGVFLGSAAAALLFKEWELVGFKDGLSMRRYIVGAFCMGFGGMLAGGCAVGAGVSGAAVFAITAWLTLFSIWFGAAATDWMVDRRMGTVQP